MDNKNCNPNALKVIKRAAPSKSLASNAILKNVNTGSDSKQNEKNGYSTIERRKNKRYQIPLNAIISDSKVEKYSPDLVHNLSRGGIKIESMSRFNIGEKVNLSIMLIDVEDMLNLSGTIVWLHRIEDNIYEYGVQFDTEFDYKEDPFCLINDEI